jgi:putative hemin transport protein
MLLVAAADLLCRGELRCRGPRSLQKGAEMLDTMEADSARRGARLNAGALRRAHEQLKHDSPGIRAREAAAQLGVREAELVAARVGEGVIRLDADFGDILKALPAAGEVMALTRNDHCVHEKHGQFDHVSIGPGHGIVLNHDIDLRLFMSHWRFGFAVTEEVASGLRSSLQFFDIDGTAVHKVYVTDKSDRAAYDALVARFAAQSQVSEVTVTPLPAKSKIADGEIGIDNFRAHWRALQDTHDFFGLLQEFGVSRAQAMRLGGAEFVTPVPALALRRLMETSAAEAIPIMCFTGNPGCIQIHTGPIRTLKIMGPWFNILDPGFNLHLREDAIDAAFIVRKPTRDGDVTSLELFDAQGFCFAQFFGERKPGRPELPGWRDAVTAATEVTA